MDGYVAKDSGQVIDKREFGLPGLVDGIAVIGVQEWGQGGCRKNMYDSISAPSARKTRKDYLPPAEKLSFGIYQFPGAV